ncbi:hypothetical protein BFN03_11300 [Rhodococcus sp. WMMA185]|nr:hypothetical protein BFN03_11300 [Rhodococcus sp. WMMA185]
MLTRKLAKQLATDRITVNMIAPGPFPTEMQSFIMNDVQIRKNALERIPLSRFGTEEDAVGAAVYLSSRAGACLTGAVIPLDGGITGTR